MVVKLNEWDCSAISIFSRNQTRFFYPRSKSPERKQMKPNKFQSSEGFFDTLRSHRWLMVATFVMMLVVLELTRVYFQAQFNFDAAYRLLLFGVAVPLLVGITFSIPSDFGKTLSLASRTGEQVKQRVLVSTKEMLLGAGIESMLMRQNELALISTISHNTIELINKIHRHKPEVIILDEKMYQDSVSELMACINERPEMRLVVVSDSENRIQIYNKRQLQVTQSMDLIETMCRI
jgi:hypothetical protein